MKESTKKVLRAGSLTGMALFGAEKTNATTIECSTRDDVHNTYHCAGVGTLGDNIMYQMEE